MTTLGVWALLAGCNVLFSDPLQTGVRVSPPPGAYVGEQRLIVHNDTDGTILCEVFEADVCPVLGDATSGLASIAAGARWEIEAIDCLQGDFVCRTATQDPGDLPLRGWSWSITPSTDDP